MKTRSNAFYAAAAAAVLAVTVLYLILSPVRGFAAETGKGTNGTGDTKKEEEDPYKLDPEVKKWLDEGGSIPADAKYSTLATTSHLWMLDSTDISDGKVILKMGYEQREIYGMSLKNWLKTQRFYGDKFGEDGNIKTFKRPGKPKPF